jgi:putative acyl-CoA dehydrogenase
VLRALARESDQAHAVLTGLAQCCAGLPGTAEAAAFIGAAVSAADAEAHARAAVEQLALLAAAAALAESGPPRVAEAFARTRLAARRGATYGTAQLDPDLTSPILMRALPA